MSAEEMKEQVAAARESADEALGHLQQAESTAEQALGQLEEVAQGTGNDKAENAVATVGRHVAKKIALVPKKAEAVLDLPGDAQVGGCFGGLRVRR